MERLRNSLIIYDSGLNYFLAEFEKRGIKAKRPLKKLSFISRVLRKLAIILNLSQGFWYDSWKREICAFQTIIIFATVDPTVISFIRKRNKKARIIYWYWNPVYRIGPPRSWMYQKAELWSFDPEDCTKYGFKFNTTFYFKDILLPNNIEEYDVIFIGNDKGRKEKLKIVREQLNKLGVKGYYHIVSKNTETQKEQTAEISYLEYLDLLSKSKTIIDILPVGQSGLTLRTMESIFFKKKLITNDAKIKSKEFYNTQNIFILGVDEIEHLVPFLNSPYLSLDNTVVYNYDVINWLERFEL